MALWNWLQNFKRCLESSLKIHFLISIISYLIPVIMAFRNLLKYCISSFLLLCVVWSSVQAQSVESKGIQWGIAVSASYHSHDYENPLDFWENSGLVFPSVALNAGIPFSFVDGPLGKRLFLQTGLRYTRLASRIDWESGTANGGETFSGKFRIGEHFLAVPVQFRVQIGKSPISVILGPEFGFLLFAQKVSDTLTPVEFQSSQTEQVGEDLNRFNVTLGGGIGYQVGARLRTFLRYNAGLSTAKKSPERTVLVSDWTTKEFELGVEFIFRGRKDP